MPDDIMAMADSRVHAAHAMRSDLLDVLFPRGGSPPSEMLQVQVKLVLQQLVLGIERQLIGDDRRRPESWETLALSALLREPELIQFALARLAEQRLRERMRKGGDAVLLAQLPTKLLGHDQPRLAELARAMLAAEQAQSGGQNALHDRLSAETLHLLCWRIVAALHRAGTGAPLVSSAKSLLENRSTERDPLATAEKLLFFLGPEFRDELGDPGHAGLSLFVAGLARDSDLASDRVLHLIDDDSCAPLLLLLRASGLSSDRLHRALEWLCDSVPEGAEESFANIDPVEARAMIAGWREASFA